MRALATAALVLLTLPLAAQQAAPLPDGTAFLREVRKHLESDANRQREFIYTETRRQQKLDPAGKVVEESVRVSDVFPGGLPGQRRYRRILINDSKPVPPAEIEKRDRERQQQVQEFARTLAKQTDAERARVAAERAEDDREDQREFENLVDDVTAAFDIRPLARETIEGHQTVVFSLTPRPNPTLKTRQGKYLPHFRGRVWFNEADHELVRVRVEAVDDVSIGFGLVARIHKGSLMTFDRRQINGEAWLPVKMTYTASARVMLLKRMRVGGITEYTNYHKPSVDTSTIYSLPDSDR